MTRLGMRLLPVIAALALLLSGCAEEGGNSGGDGNGGDGAATAKVGQPLSLEGTTYTVTKATTAKAVGGEFNRAQADGTFVIVNLTLRNEKDEPATILEDAVRLLGGNGKEYTVSTEAAFSFKNPLLLLEEIQPDLSKKLVAVYDVPPKAVKGAKQQVKDLFSDATGEIALGL